MKGKWFTTSVYVQYRDVDSAGHVNNAVYLHYLEDMRMEFLKRLYGKYDCEDIDFVLAGLTINYHSRAAYRETLLVNIRPTKVGNTSWAFDFNIVEKKTRRLICDGASVQVIFDYKKGRKRPIPKWLREKLEAVL